MKISSKELAEELAGRLTDAMDMEVLVDFYYEQMEDYYLNADDAELEQIARDLQVLTDDEDFPEHEGLDPMEY